MVASTIFCFNAIFGSKFRYIATKIGCMVIEKNERFFFIGSRVYHQHVFFFFGKNDQSSRSNRNLNFFHRLSRMDDIFLNDNAPYQIYITYSFVLYFCVCCMLKSVLQI